MENEQEKGKKNLIKLAQLVNLNLGSQVPALMLLKLYNTVVLLSVFGNNDISKIQNGYYLPKYAIYKWIGL